MFSLLKLKEAQDAAAAVGPSTAGDDADAVDDVARLSDDHIVSKSRRTESSLLEDEASSCLSTGGGQEEGQPELSHVTTKGGSPDVITLSTRTRLSLIQYA